VYKFILFGIRGEGAVKIEVLCRIECLEKELFLEVEKEESVLIEERFLSFENEDFLKLEEEIY
jgi:hypothetical protein